MRNQQILLLSLILLGYQATMLGMDPDTANQGPLTKKKHQPVEKFVKAIPKELEQQLAVTVSPSSQDTVTVDAQAAALVEKHPQAKPGELNAEVNKSIVPRLLGFSRNVRGKMDDLRKGYDPKAVIFGTGSDAEDKTFAQEAVNSFKDNNQPLELATTLVFLDQASEAEERRLNLDQSVRQSARKVLYTELATKKEAHNKQLRQALGTQSQALTMEIDKLFAIVAATYRELNALEKQQTEELQLYRKGAYTALQLHKKCDTASDDEGEETHPRTAFRTRETTQKHRGFANDRTLLSPETRKKLETILAFELFNEAQLNAVDAPQKQSAGAASAAQPQ